MPHDRLVFDHLPKTAGTSIIATLDSLFHEDGALPDIASMHFRVMRGARDRRLVAGHLWFMEGEPLALGWYYCTLLRDPVDRFLSQYAYNRASAARFELESQTGAGIFADPAVRGAQRHSLREFLELDDPAIKRSYANFQAVHFARRVCTNPHELSDEALLDAAIASLGEYDLVGTFDDLQGFIDAICHDFGFAEVPLPRLNVNEAREGRAQPEPDLVERLRRANAVDARLMQWSVKRYARKRRSGQAGEAAPVATSRRRDYDDGDLSDLQLGSREVQIASFSCLGKESGTGAVLSGECLEMALEIDAKIPVDDLTIGIRISTAGGQLVYGTNSRLLGMRIPIREPQRLRRYLRLDARLGVGAYSIQLALHRGETHLEGCFHWMEDAGRFLVVGHKRSAFEGLSDLSLEIRTDPDRLSHGRFSALDTRVATIVGARTADGRIMSTGKAGFMMFGPYVPWSAGRFRATIFGSVVADDGELGRIDVAHSAGQSLVASRPITAEQAEALGNGALAVIDFALEVPVSDLEVRAFVAERTALSISGYEIVPVD